MMMMGPRKKGTPQFGRNVIAKLLGMMILACKLANPTTKYFAMK
jgi:hypothetical protein